MEPEIRLSSAEKVWYCSVAALGLGIAAVAAFQVTPAEVVGIGALFLLITFVSLFRTVRLSSDVYHSVYTLDDVPLYALIFLRGWALTALVALVSRLLYELYRLARAWRLHPERINRVHVIYHFCDIPLVTIVAAATGAVYQLVDQGAPLLSGTRNTVAILAAIAVWFPLGFALNAVNLTLRRNRPLGDVVAVIHDNLRHIKIHVAMLVPLGALLAVFYEKAPFEAVLLYVPVVLMHNALDQQHKLRQEARQVVQALAQTLEERDPYTLGHSARVAGYAAEIAVELGMTADEVDQVRRAGLIHDIGKVDIQDRVLHKPGHLTQDERDSLRVHTDQAIELGKKAPALREELPFAEAAYHHENYDGTGYYGLKGEDIPLTSRILAVADTYDAMTSDRPYRKGLPAPEALRRLKEAAGTQLEGRLVEAFLRAHASGCIDRVAREWYARTEA